MSNQVAADLDVLMAAVESSYGTDPTPTEGVDIRGDITTSADRTAVERARVWAKQGGVAHGVIDNQVTFSFQVAIAGIEDADDGVPGVHPFLVGGGMEATLSGTEVGGDVEAAYAFVSSGKGSWAGYRYLYDLTTGNQIRLKLLGCRNNFEIVGSLNGELLMNVEGTALYAEWEAVASLSDPSSYGYGNAGIEFQDLTFTLGGTNRYIKNFSLGSNWQIGNDDAVNGASTIREVLLHRDGGSNRPGGSFDPVMLSSDFAASSSHVAASRAGTEQALALSIDDGTSTFDISGPKAQIDPNLSLQKDAALRRFDTPYLLSVDTVSGDDELAITFGLNQP